jgi:PTS system sucrose-specific IIC component
MDYAKSAQEVLDKVGGRDNIVSAAHCATRLRLVIVDNSKVDKTALENVDGVKGVFEASGQTQIIFGTGTVNKVYDEFIKAAGISESSKDEAKAAAAQKQNIVMRGIKLLGDIFVPIIPAIVASGLLLGIMSALNFMNAEGYIALDTGSAFYNVISLVSSTAFQFLQILIGFSAAKAFGANPYLGAVIGGILINPNMESAYNLAALSAEGAVPMMPVFGGLWSVEWVGYQGHVIPIVIACCILAFIEKRLHKVVPDAIDLFVTPLVSVFVTAFVTLVAVGPIFVAAENAVLYAVQWLLTLPFGIGAFIVGGLYAPTVVTGLHQMYTAIDLGQIAAYGVTFWLPIASAANIGQAGACLAVAVKTKDAKIRSLALPSALSAFLGITEPAIFGVNLRFFKSFVAGCIGGACGALVCALTNLGAVGTGVTGVFGILLCLNQPVQYIIMFAVATVVSFAISFVLYSDKTPEKQQERELEASAQEISVAEEISDTVTAQQIVSPVSGTYVAAADVADATFAAEILGPTVAIEPDATAKEFIVESPVEGVVTTVFETGHAVGVTGVSGVEILLHIGIDTVKLGGKGFTKLCEQGERVKAGEPLVKVEPAAVKEAGYPLTTMVIVSNGYDFNVEKLNVAGTVAAGAGIMDVERNA